MLAHTAKVYVDRLYSMFTDIELIIAFPAPPTTQAVSVEFSCDVSQVDPVPVTVNLIVRDME